MKVLIFTDNHFCEMFSYVRKMGLKYSVRLENQIKSLNWVEEQAVKNGCCLVICAGDFFNSPELNDHEITALQDIAWNGNLQHYFLVGNHESDSSSLEFSSTKALEGPNRWIVNEPYTLGDTDEEICFLPYITESDRKPLAEYFSKPRAKKRVIISHNNLRDIQFGPVKSQTGFSVPEIEENCDLFVNGHIHNGTKITDKVINLGNLTGQRFDEDSLLYTHNIMILDTEALEYKLIENPYAINFYRFTFNTEADLKNIAQIKPQAVLSCKVKESILPMLQSVLAEYTDKIIDFKTVCFAEVSEDGETPVTLVLQKDGHLHKLVQFCHEQLAPSDILEEELSIICAET